MRPEFHDLSDSELLKKYLSAQEQSAFTELVRRNLPLVYSAAARKLGCDRAAEDIAQTVFLELAQNARKLVQHPALAGWLYTTASRLAADHVRHQARRSRREQKLMELDDRPETGNIEVAWHDLKPLLDTALAELPDDDRHIVILRCLEGRDFASIGRELGVTADAARMRVSRSHERLRAVLARFGITSSVAALELILSQHSVEAVPARIAPSITESLHTLQTAGFSWLNLVARFKLATAAILFFITAGIATVALKPRAGLLGFGPLARASQSARPVTPADTIRMLARPSALGLAGAQVAPEIAEALAVLRSAIFDVPLGAPERYRLLKHSAGLLVGHEGDTISIFREGLASPNLNIALMAAEALGHFGELPREFGPELLRLLQNPNAKESAGLIANRLISSIITNAPVSELISVLESRPDLKDQLKDLLVAAVSANPQKVEAHRAAVAALLANPSEEIQSAAREVLGEFPQTPPPPDPERGRRLVESLRSSDDLRQLTAIAQLKSFQSINPEISSALVELTKQGSSPHIRLAAQYGLGWFAANDSLPDAAAPAADSNSSRAAATPSRHETLSVAQILERIADNPVDMAGFLQDLSRIDPAYWKSHVSESVEARNVLTTLGLWEKRARVHEAASQAVSRITQQPPQLYTLDQLSPFFGAMESALSPGEYAISMRDLRSSLLNYWKGRGFIEPAPSHLPLHLLQLLFVGPAHENRAAYDQMLNAMRREVDPAFQPPPAL